MESESSCSGGVIRCRKQQSLRWYPYSKGGRRGSEIRCRDPCARLRFVLREVRASEEELRKEINFLDIMATMENYKRMVIPVTLNGDNYLLWARSAKNNLGSCGLWHHIEAVKGKKDPTEVKEE
ncbi:unnamed protein product [Cochlearia groenlandica]